MAGFIWASLLSRCVSELEFNEVGTMKESRTMCRAPNDRDTTVVTSHHYHFHCVLSIVRRAH